MPNYVKYMRNMIGNKPMFLVGAGVIISDKEQRILLIKRTDNGMWGLPGGSMELGETFEQAAAREVTEETGLSVSKLTLFRVFSGERMHFTYPNGDEVYNAVCIFETNSYCGKLTADDVESSSVAFYKETKLPDELHPPDKIIIMEYLAERENNE